MKIITENAVYVQLNDMGFLNQTDLPIPATIYLKTFGQGPTTIDDRNRFDFIKFEEPSEIEYFRSLDWMIDYNEVKDLDESALMELGQSISATRNAIADQFNAMTAKEQSENQQMVEECEMLDFKIYSLRDIIWYKQGRLPITMPEEVVHTPVSEEVVEEAASVPQIEETSPETGIKRFFKRFKRNSKKQ